MNMGSNGDMTEDVAQDGSTGRVGDADRAFALGMLAHHQQAIAMTTMAVSRSASPEVAALALKIIEEDRPEITTLEGWLSSSGAMATAELPQGGPGTAMQPGSAASGLAGLTGYAYDRAFLDAMIEHQKAGTQLADIELRDGAFTPAKSMAKAIATAQREEIVEMEHLANTV
jgi:uncharacterized protein (DUF305 family)